ncbi:MAG: helix-turn-helix transcriptional regulator [Rhizobiaceae bacterium]
MAKSLHTNANAKLIGVIVRARKSSGLTQQTVADRLGKPQSYVAKIEGEERRLDVAEFVELAHAVDADPKDLFGKFLKELDAR